MRWAYVSFVLGMLLCLICAFLISEGNILGENKGWAVVVGIVGMGLIGASGAWILEYELLPIPYTWMFRLGWLRHRKRKEEGRFCRDCFYYESRTDEKGWCNVKKGSVGWNSVCQQFLARAKV